MSAPERTSDGEALAPVKQDAVQTCPSCLEPLFGPRCEACGYVPPPRVDRRDEGDERCQRWDFATEGDLDPPETTEEGFLRVDGRISRVGIQEYQDGAGKVRRELRLPEEVFDPVSLASFDGRPLTNNHPENRVDGTNVRQLAVGGVGMPRPDGDYARARLTVWDADAIKDVRAGKAQLSCGYSCEMDVTQDPTLVEKWGRYDSIQRKIRGNHVALVDRARAGEGARLRLDRHDAFLTGHPAAVESDQQEIQKMTQLKVGKLSFEVADANIQAAVDQAIDDVKKTADAEKARADAAEKKHDELEAEVDKLTARADADEDVKCDECASTGKVDGESCEHCAGKGTLAKKADSFERRIVSRQRSTARAAKERSLLIDQARSVLGRDAKLDDKTDHEIKRQVARKDNANSAKIIAKLDGEEGKRAHYVDALFQRAIDAAGTAPAQPTTPRTPDDDPNPEAARQRMIARQDAARKNKKGGE